jgi:transcriptional regulator with XRE-family HTH domain
MQAKQPNHERIRELRESRGWSQQQLAEIAGVSPRTIQRVEAGRGASQETLRAVASAFDTEVSELLETAKPPPPVPKVTLLPRITSGEDLCNVVGGAHMYQQDYDAPSDQAEVDLIGAFLQEAHDIGEIWDDAEPMHRVQWAHGIGESLRAIETAGFRVFGGRVVRRFRFGNADPIPMSVATLLVVRADSPKILHRNTDREHLAAVFGQAA